MKSGDPEPNDDLRLVMASKQSAASQTVEIVSEASRWLKSALKGVDVAFNYAACEENYYGFSVFTIIRRYRQTLLSLELKIAEVRSKPYVFAEVHSLGRIGGTLFPFFGDLQSDDERDRLLHYVADFILSSEDSGRADT